MGKKNVPTLCLAHGNELLFNHVKKSQRIIQTIQKVSYIIANSQYTASLIAELMPKRKNINFVYPGANDLRQIKADNFMQINGDPVLVTLARLEKRKGHAEILKAVKQLKLKFSSIQYIIAGEGPEKLRLQKLVKEYSLESNVSIVGIMNDSQKKYLFENTDLMVMPTLDEREKRSVEGFGISYLEAAFFGIPSIASKFGGSPEAVLHNQTGIVIDNFDHLYKTIYNLLSNSNLRNHLGKQAQKRAIQDFRWETVVNNYLAPLSL